MKKRTLQSALMLLLALSAAVTPFSALAESAGDSVFFEQPEGSTSESDPQNPMPESDTTKADDSSSDVTVGASSDATVRQTEIQSAESESTEASESEDAEASDAGVPEATGPTDGELPQRAGNRPAPGDPFAYMVNEYARVPAAPAEIQQPPMPPEQDVSSGTSEPGEAPDDAEPESWTPSSREPEFQAVQTERYLVRYAGTSRAEAEAAIAAYIKESIPLWEGEAAPPAELLRRKTDLEALLGASDASLSDALETVPTENERDSLLAEYIEVAEAVARYERARLVSEALPEFELLILEEKVLPSEFAETLHTAGMGAHILYIQPDYVLQLDSLELSIAGESDKSASGVNSVKDAAAEKEPPSKVTETETVISDDESSSAGEPSSSSSSSSSEEPVLPPESDAQENENETESSSSEDMPDVSSDPDAVPSSSTPTDASSAAPPSSEKDPIRESDAPLITLPVRPPVVAVIDTGIDIRHSMIEKFVWENTGEMADNRRDDDANGYADDLHGYNFAAGGPNLDADAHGTHVAGIIAQVAEKAGADIEIMPLQVFRDGRAYTSDIIAAIRYAAANGASVINMSFGSKEDNPALYEAILCTDALFVAAAGNHRADMSVEARYPAAYRLEHLISVASTNADDGFSYYSNYGAELIDLSARGRDVLSALPGGEEGIMTGTSMSAGYVSGVAATVSAQNSLRAEDLKTRLIETGDSLEHLLEKVADGRRINLQNALNDERDDTVQSVDCEDDFDVHGYQPTAEESWKLYQSSGEVIQVTGASMHTVVLMANGTVWTWGDNWIGQLGNGMTDPSSTPVQVVGLTNVKAVSAGDCYTLALKHDGTVWAWGDNAYGELGDGTRTDRYVPVCVSGLTGVQSMEAGYYHGTAVKTNGTVWGWGANHHGQLGDGTTTNRNTPAQMLGISGVKTLSAGFEFTVALKTDGTVWGVGLNDYGQIGDNTTTERHSPVRSGALTNVAAITTGDYHAIALKTDGTLWGWGQNYGQLGDGTTTARPAPVQMNNVNDAAAVTAGSAHTVVLRRDGTVWSCGSNWAGHLGDGTTTGRTALVRATGVSFATTVGAGAYNTFAILADGTLWGWGDNDLWQLGNERASKYLLPIQIEFDLFASNGRRNLTVETGKSYYIQITGTAMTGFAGATYTLTYDPAKLLLADFAVQTAEANTAAGSVSGTPLTIVSHANGVLVFQSSQTVAFGRVWSGLIALVEFRAVSDGITPLSVF